LGEIELPDLLGTLGMPAECPGDELPGLHPDRCQDLNDARIGTL
jgi:hypothetical protein